MVASSLEIVETKAVVLKPTSVVPKEKIKSLTRAAMVLGPSWNHPLDGLGYLLDKDWSIEQIAAAIYVAEGGRKTSKPYGVLGRGALSMERAKQICMSTIRKNMDRYKRWKSKYPNTKITFLEFLAGIYAPRGAKNDPKDLNANWLRNILKILKRNEEKAEEKK